MILSCGYLKSVSFRKNVYSFLEEISLGEKVNVFGKIWIRGLVLFMQLAVMLSA